jgi:hypothetical protein
MLGLLIVQAVLPYALGAAVAATAALMILGLVEKLAE